MEVVEFFISINLSSNRFQGKNPKLKGNLKVLADESNYLLGERRENLHGPDTFEKHSPRNHLGRRTNNLKNRETKVFLLVNVRTIAEREKATCLLC